MDELETIKELLKPKICQDEFVCKFMINIYGLHDVLFPGDHGGEQNQNVSTKHDQQQQNGGRAVKFDPKLIDIMVDQGKQKKKQIIATIEEKLLQSRNQEIFKRKKSKKNC